MCKIYTAEKAGFPNCNATAVTMSKKISRNNLQSYIEYRKEKRMKEKVSKKYIYDKK